MWVHLTKSSKAKKFLKEHGITMTKDSCHNYVVFKDSETGKELQIWAESDNSIASGIPGIFVDQITRKPAVHFRPGDVVTLKPSLDKAEKNYCPEGRSNNSSAIVQANLANGGICLVDDLRGCRYWNEDDLIKKEKK